MEGSMSLNARKELLVCIRQQYRKARWKEKRKILDGFIAATGYKRKYAIALINQPENKEVRLNKRVKPIIYNDAVRQSLLTVWYAANQICSKRLVPFIPELVHKLEFLGHLSLPSQTKELLLKMSVSTVDRLLKAERLKAHKGIITTRPGNLLKKQIQVKTFTEWNEVVPGFLEVDLVAHCGGSSEGSFLNTLVLTDIASTWTECLPLLRKGKADVISALQVVQSLLPFPLLGIDSDNGSEFINYELLHFCESKHITFTRSRAYRKNDQAHVEEKNGSIVRKIIGYDRYEGTEAWQALGELYAVLRLYINFFQPSMKLISKHRTGAKIRKKYDQAQTPYQRLLVSSHIQQGVREKIRKQYEELDPIKLLKGIESLQNRFWQYSWKEKTENSEGAIILSPSKETKIRQYRRTPKPKKLRTWRTHKDPFENIWPALRIRLEISPHCTAKELMMELVKNDPDQFHMKQLRTLQRRVAEWHMNKLGYMSESKASARSSHYLALAQDALKPTLSSL